jgi:DNA-binding response OmpR family regulator
MPGNVPGPLIAVMNSSADLVSILETALEEDGFRVVTLVSTITGGAAGPLAFLRIQQPAAAVYSISPPYRESWDILQEVRQRWQGGHYVIITTNLGALRACVGRADAIELIGKPFDLDEITRALRRVLAGRQASLDETALTTMPGRLNGAHYGGSGVAVPENLSSSG